MYLEVLESSVVDGPFALEQRKQLPEVQVPRVFRSVTGNSKLEKQEGSHVG